MELDRSESAGNLQKIRERTKSVGDVPKTLFLPYSSRFQVSSSFKFHVFLLLQFFLNICYFTLITPFRITKISKRNRSTHSYKIQTNPIQQVLSTLVIIICSIYALLDLRYWVEQNLKKSPQKAFEYASYLLRGFGPLLWAVTFWLKRKWFEKLLVVCQGKKESQNPLLGFKTPQLRKSFKPSNVIRGIVNLLVVLTFIKIVFQLHNNWNWEWKTLVGYNAHLALYNLHLRKWADGWMEYEDIQYDPLYLTLGAIGSFFYVMDVYLENMFDLLCFMGAAMTYAVCGHFSDEMEKLSRMTSSSSTNSNDYQQSKKILRAMQTNYVDLIAILESINEVFGSLIVLYFLRSYPTLVWSVFGLFRKVTLDMAVFYLHKIAVFILVTLTAAEGNTKVQQFKQWLFHTSVAASTMTNQDNDDDNFSLNISVNEYNQKVNDDMGKGNVGISGGIDMSSLNVLHRELSTESLGLKGYKFFTVTHGLIGTVCKL